MREGDGADDEHGANAVAAGSGEIEGDATKTKKKRRKSGGGGGREGIDALD